MIGLELHLSPSKPERRQSGGGVRLVAQAVPGLLGRRAMVSQAVGLDDQPEIGPVEIDLVAVESLLRLGSRKTGLADYREEEALER